MLIPLLISAVLFFSSINVHAANISSGNTFSSMDGTSGKLVINSIDSYIMGSSWSITVSYTINMVNSWLYTGGNEYYRFFIAQINGVTGPAARIKENTESWYSGTSHSFTYNVVIPVDPNNNIVSARFKVTDLAGNMNDVATFDTGTGNTVTLQPAQKATGLSLNISNTTLYTGQTQNITPTVTPSNTYNKTVSYSSSNNDVATVSPSGIITAIRAGSATITVTTKDGSNISRTIAVTVNQYVTGISVNNTSPSIYAGNTFQIDAVAAPSDATDKSLSYSSSNTAIATVNAGGLITAAKAGTATVTVTALDRSTVNTIVTVTVLQKAASLTIDNPIVILYTGETHQLNCSVLPDDTSDKSLIYTSSDTTVAAVSGTGLITAIKSGTTIITAETADGSDITKSMELTVKQYVTSFDVTPIDPVLYVGSDEQLNITALPADATDKTFSCTTSDETIASVNSTGLISAKKAGTANIIITAEDRNIISKMITVTVKQKAQSISIDNQPDEIYLKNSYQLNYTVLPADTTDKSVTYSSSNNEVATIDSSGLITPISKGRTTITVTANDGSAVSKSFEIEINQYVEYVTSAKNELTLYTNEYESLAINVLPADANNQELEFTSSDNMIANVNAYGKVTAVKAGTAVITITAKDGSNSFATVLVTVKQYAESINVSESQVELPIENTYQIVPAVFPNDSTDKRVTYTSSDENILTVDENGLVTALGLGKARIIITAIDRNTVSQEVNFTVKRLISDIVISEDTPSEVYTGQKISIVCDVQPSDASNQALEYTSSDENIAMIDENGNITGLKEGTATISVSSRDGTNIRIEISIHVRQIINSITFDTDTIQLNEGETYKVNPIVLPQNSYNTKLQYKSSNAFIVTVEPNGTIKAINKGIAIVTAEATDGSGVQAHFKVIVNKATNSITISPVKPNEPINGNTPSVTANKVDTSIGNYITQPEDSSDDTLSKKPFIDSETVKWIVFMLGIIGLLLLIIFRRQLLFPIFIDDDDDDEKEKKEKK